ncbi:D-alanyl-D-alanine carboxypeptidase [Pseudochrobactrum lubricantis]|uniref:D-alanyl-D-alanine carboxypeptidase n=1 Tax=Pseudochrobactrum lubricantis TaxID=558172 RepID=UPI0035E2D50C
MVMTTLLQLCINKIFYASRIGIFLLLSSVFLYGVPSRASANAKYASYVVDAKSGQVLYSENGNSERYPASLTKMMTLYLTFEGLDAGRFNSNSRIVISRNAASEPPSKIGLPVGSVITVEAAMNALVTKSANDVATALGEFLGGSEERFAKMATDKARSLGMTSTRFRNAHGLPDSKQVTTAKDMARLGIALRQHFPHHYKIFQTRSYQLGKTTLRSHNRLVGSVRGVDGIKTGYINASGFNLVTSVERDGRSVVAVVMGGRTAASRDSHMRKLIERYLPDATKTKKGSTIKPQPSRNDLIASVGNVLPRIVPIPGNRGLNAATRSYAESNDIPNTVSSYSAVDPLTTSALETAGENDKWAIQIAASPDKASAKKLLDQAISDLNSPIRSLAPVVANYFDGNISVYRARIVGFEQVSSALSACVVLKQKGYGCWATQ